jgi:peptidoglycan/LPS O-acetylase OafA/YrhL
MIATTRERIAMPFLPYLEGLRGVVALYVVLFHIRRHIEAGWAPFGPTSALIPFGGQFLMYGHYAVGVFIVISGFVLTLPIAVRGTLGGGPIVFLKRRARRLFPAYYAALTLAVPLYLIFLAQEHAHTTLKAVIAQYTVHALFLHDLWVRTAYNIDGPLWSVAVEVQIYFVFALLLLPILRRHGISIMVATAFALGCAPAAYGALRHIDPPPLAPACFWFLGLFALGSAAALIGYHPGGRYTSARTKIPWKVIAAVTGIVFAYWVAPVYNDESQRQTLPRDILLGCTIASGFIAIANDIKAGRRSMIATVLGWPPFVALGTFSYSLYLIHFPIVVVVMRAILPWHPAAKLLVAYGVLPPALLLLAYLFARAFEFPFVSSARRDADAVLLHAPQPAPEILVEAARG